MQRGQTVWFLQKQQTETAERLAAALDISKVMAQLLVNRGILDVQQARLFLYGSLKDLSDPYCMQGMKEAAARIEKAMEHNEKIVVYGDYDVDGVCSAAILLDCFKQLSYPVDHYIPDRFAEGYGLNRAAVQKLADEGCKLLITVDCGISSIAECELARQCGMDVIITDHHTPPEVLAPVIIINPKNDGMQDIYDLAGAGVAFKLACALAEKHLPEDYWMNWLDLVALATVADVVPLQRENRILVKHGLELLAKTRRPGLRALLDLTGLSGKPLQSWHIGFVLGPRLNSAGRLATAEYSLDLLMSCDEEEAAALAKKLDELNEERRSLEDAILQDALEQIEQEELANDAVIVVGGEGWHDGVIGIVASRICEKYNRPCIVISWQGERGKGSGRSVEGFNLYEALQYCQDDLERFGGHRMAAGLSISSAKYEDFCCSINEYGQKQELVFAARKGYADLQLSQDELSMELYSEISSLEPFGEGNPVPIFVLRGAELERGSWMGSQKEHFRCQLRPGLEIVAFNCPDWQEKPLALCRYDLFFQLSVNEYQGKVKLQLKVKDIQASLAEAGYSLSRLEMPARPAWVERVIAELAEGRKVLIIYPTYRALRKHEPLLSSYFNSRILYSLHGNLRARDREVLHDAFKGNRAGVFLSTAAYIHYYMKHYEMPRSLRTVIGFWLSEQGTRPYEEMGYEVLRVPVSDYSLNAVSEWQPSGGQAALLYTNLPATIKEYKGLYPDAYVEAGVQELHQRSWLRQRFGSTEDGIIITDGLHLLPRPWGGNYETILIDAPFGAYELAALYDEEEKKVQTSLAFGPEAVERNIEYLQRIYPDLDLIKQVLAALLSTNKGELQATEAELLRMISKQCGYALAIQELRATLRILSDLGLCEPGKRGSIMAIKFIPSKNQNINIYESPYFVEGLISKKVMQQWQKEVETCLAW